MKKYSLRLLLAACLVFPSTGTFQAKAGTIDQIIYDGIEGTAVQDLLDAEDDFGTKIFPESFSEVRSIHEHTEYFEGGFNIGDNYGSWMRGYIHAPQTGEYTFWLSSDDASELWLSTGVNPADKQLIAEVRDPNDEDGGGWTNPDEWDKYATQQSAPIELVAGQKYFVEVLHKEGEGGDHVRVGWTLPDGTVERPMSRKYVQPFAVLTGNDPGNLPPTIVEQPMGAELIEGQSILLQVAATATQPATYQWYRTAPSAATGTLLPGETFPYLLVEDLALSDDLSNYYVEVQNAHGTATSFEAWLVVEADTESPTVVSVGSRLNPRGVAIDFSRPLEVAGAENTANYSISGGISVTSASLSDDGLTVQLTLDTDLAFDTSYTVQVSNVRDRAPTPNTIDPNPTSVEFEHGGDFPSGIQFRKYDDIGGTAVANLLNSAKFINNQPDEVRFDLELFEDPTPSGTDNENFGVWLFGWITPPQSGVYHFAVSSDDNSELYLSTDANPQNKVLIANEPQWNDARNFAVTDRRPNQENQSTYRFPDGFFLEAGQAYYIEGFMKEGAVGNNFSATWRRDEDPDFVNGQEPIGVEHFTRPPLTLGDVAIVEQPESLTVPESTSATFSVLVEGSPLVDLAPPGFGPDAYAFQWFGNGEPIAGANERTFTIPVTATEHHEMVVTVEVSNDFSSAVSDEATLTIEFDTEPPQLLGATANSPFLNSVLLEFDELLDQESAEDVSNYTISTGLTVESAQLQANGTSVILTTSLMTEGATYIVTVDGVKDISIAGNAVENETAEFTAWQLQRGGLTRLFYWKSDLGVGNFVTDAFLQDGGHPDEMPAGWVPFGTPPPHTQSTIINIFESQRDIADEYGVVMFGYLAPPVTGEYQFFMASDDNGLLFLSTDDDPANAVQIAEETGWAGYRDWFSSGGDGRPQPTNRSEPITLQAGQIYYVAGTFNEWGGGDGMEVTWQLPGASGPEPFIAAQHLASIMPVREGEPAITTQSPAPDSIEAHAFAPIVLSLSDGTSQVEINSIAMTLNGQTVTPEVTHDLGLTVISYEPSEHYPMGSVQNPVITYQTTSGAQVTENWTFTSTVMIPGTRFVQGEDFNFTGSHPTTGEFISGGGWIEGANGGPTGQPYVGGAYEALGATLGVDYNEINDDGAQNYRVLIPLVGMNPQPTSTFRGHFHVQNNFRVGWTVDGEWWNYTRDFPAEERWYKVYASLTSGAGDTGPRLALHRVTSDPAQPDQTLEELGFFSGPPTGDWDLARLFPLRHSIDGEEKLIRLSGLNTIRLTKVANGLDVDFLAFVPVEPEEAQLVSLSPGAGARDVATDGAIQVVLADGASPLDLDSIVLTVNGVEVTPSVSREGIHTTIEYSPGWGSFETQEVVLTYATQAGVEGRHEWSFRSTLIIPAEGARFIEAEDYNFDGGQWIEGANGGPFGGSYEGGAYAGLGAIAQIDYFDVNNDGAENYRAREHGIDPLIGKNPFDNEERGDLVRGEFSVVNNWKIGWTAEGDWMNYTRDFPETATTYHVFARMSSGGGDPNARLDLVTGDPTAADQTLAPLGRFSGPATSNWDLMHWFQLHEMDDPNTPARVTLSSVNTVRFTVLPGALDIDYLVFVPAPDVVAFTEVRVENGTLILEWVGEGQLESAPTVEGPWTVIEDAQSPFEVTDLSAEAQFFRIRQ